MGQEEDVSRTNDGNNDTNSDNNDKSSATSTDSPPPPLPPRHKPSADGTARHDEPGPLQSKPTTALSPIDIQTLSFPDGTRSTFSTASGSGSGPATPSVRGGVGTRTGSDLADSMSIMSLAPTMTARGPPGDLASLVAGELSRKSPAWMLLRSQAAVVPPFESMRIDTPNGFADFAHEFDAIPDVAAADADVDADVDADERSASFDDGRLLLWKSKLKHYMILSSAGKPIYSRHGDLSLINSSMGVVQTIISFYEGARNPLLGFTAGNARFVVATRGPLYFVAVSRLGESDSQLRDQLEALYMQILSTLTLPALQHIFANRPSSDLRKPLEGTEALLSALADSFTRGSPSALLGALECLRLRKSQRLAVTSALLKARSPRLLYGLVVAGGRLVGVVRPRKHSLYPSDLQLIFNMLFESGGVRAGGGENWIPLCLPAFNNRGYLYMYVSFFDDDDGGGGEAKAETPEAAAVPPPASVRSARPDEEIAIVLISPDKESFFELREMRDKAAQQLARNGSLAVIRAAARAGRARVADVAPGSPLSHFLYKSRANVQFCMAALDDHHQDDGDADGGGRNASTAAVARRRLMTLYHQLHAAVHARYAHLRVMHCVGVDAAGLAWVTPAFELYCVAGPNASRAAVTQGANRIVQWVKREEERLFIIGGGVF